MTTFKIDRLSLEGDGVGRVNGKVAFVPYTLPTEEISAEPLFQKKNFGRYLPNKIIRASTDRQTPPCPHHFQVGRKNPWCGGCDWQHLKPSVQPQIKQALVRETLERIGHIKNPPLHPTLTGVESQRYRNKVQVPIGGNPKRIQAGFYSPGSHDIVEFNDCLVQSEVSVKIVHVIKRLAEIYKWMPYDEDSGRGWLRHLLIRTNQQNQAIVVLITKNPGMPERAHFLRQLREECPSVVGVLQNIQPARTHVILGREWIHLWGQDFLEETLLGLRYHYHPGSFFQVNTKAAEILYKKAIEDLKIESNDTVVDLYCGVGAMTLLAAQKAKEAVGVEVVRSAVVDARRNAEINRINNARFIEADAGTFFESRDFKKIDPNHFLALVDPPRAGCDPNLIKELLKRRPKRLVYVSCNPATLARDLHLLSSLYRLTSVTPVDLFPQTSHIESVAQLERLSQ